jgi:SAM-dependent methyltransferase
VSHEANIQVGEDAVTSAYFDSHVPEYSEDRLDFAVEYIRAHAQPGASLVDLGCGVGNTLAYVREKTQVTDVAGLDVSENCLARTRERVDCETYRGSVFDPAFVATIDRRFDFAIVAAVLHHLIGKSRSESRRYARLALANSAALLKPGGHLIVIEPIFYPPSAMTALFYVKKAMSKVSTKRVGIGGYWNNIGVPVVSYYTNEELQAMVEGTDDLKVVDRDVEPESLGRVLDRVLRKTNTTLIARREPQAAAA